VTITRSGATQEYASNWAQAFGKKASGPKTAARTPKPPKKKDRPSKKKTSRKESK
jgi:hypothetical protein